MEREFYFFGKTRTLRIIDVAIWFVLFVLYLFVASTDSPNQGQKVMLNILGVIFLLTGVVTTLLYGAGDPVETAE